MNNTTPTMKAHAMATRSQRTFTALTRDKEGKPVVAEITQPVTVTLHTTGAKGDRRVFFRGARVA